MMRRTHSSHTRLNYLMTSRYSHPLCVCSEHDLYRVSVAFCFLCVPCPSIQNLETSLWLQLALFAICSWLWSEPVQKKARTCPVDPDPPLSKAAPKWYKAQCDAYNAKQKEKANVKDNEKDSEDENENTTTTMSPELAEHDTQTDPMVWVCTSSNWSSVASI